MAQNIFNTPADLLVGVKAKFYDAFSKTADSAFKPFVFEDTSENAAENYVFADVFPTIKKWVGARNAQSLKAYNITATPEDWEVTIKELRNTIKDGKAKIGGVIEMSINASVQKFKRLIDKGVQEVLDANTVAFDGTAIFATDRAELKGTNAINNLHTGTGITLATLYADLTSAKDLIRGMKDRNDEPFNEEEKFLVLCPTHLIELFNSIKLAENLYISGTLTNTHKGTFEIIKNSRQSTSDNDWYLINAANPFPPFIHVLRQKPEWEMKDDKEDKYVKYFGDARAVTIPGNPMAIVKVNN